MKELTEKEKAQRYDEALERAKEWYNPTDADLYTCIVESVFPELKESEDEKIRKELLEHCKNQAKPYIQTGNKCPQIQSWIAWLEKQGEKKPVDKIQLGKKYKCIASPRYSTFMKGEIYKPEDKFLCRLMNFCSDCFEPIENGEQKETLCDKCRKEHPSHSCQDTTELGKCAVEHEKKSADNIESSTFKDKLLELFQRFRWYCKDKTQTNGDIIEYVDAHIQELIDALQNKPWSEEDEQYFSFLEKLLNNLQVKSTENEIKKGTNSNTEYYFKVIQWLKSLKDRVGCEANCTTTKEWSEEDRKRIQRISDFIWKNRKGDTDDIYQQEQDVKWLKSLKDRVGCEANCTTTKEWSEEDEDTIKFLISHFCVSHYNRSFQFTSDKLITHDELIEKIRNLRPHWKPSEEQMTALKEVIDVGYFTSCPNALETLYEQLKQL